jgi:hypothetical protein
MALSLGDGLISWPRNRIAATTLAAIRMASLVFGSRLAGLAHEGFCFGAPRVICVSLYRYAFQQHELVTTAEDRGGLADGCLCSVWGSMAKHVMEQPQPVQLTTQAEDIGKG